VLLLSLDNPVPAEVLKQASELQGVRTVKALKFV